VTPAQDVITALELPPAEHTWRQIALALITELETRYKAQAGLKRPAPVGKLRLSDEGRC
jgi:hypothetical protein